MEGVESAVKKVASKALISKLRSLYVQVNSRIKRTLDSLIHLAIDGSGAIHSNDSYSRQ